MSTYSPRGREVVEKKCPNHECPEHDIVCELPAWEEFGRLFLCRRTNCIAANAARK
jgi:hypothetical protein